VPGDARSAAEKSLAARRAVRISWANTSDPAARTAPARRARLERLANTFDPGHELSDEERERRAGQLRRAELAGFSAKAAKARRRKNGNGR
jgi:hypothetical protein